MMRHAQQECKKGLETTNHAWTQTGTHFGQSSTQPWITQTQCRWSLILMGLVQLFVK
jgi:hypothetical protein